MNPTSAAQLNYDHALPLQADDYLETTDGQQWLTEAIDDLMHRRNITAPNAVGKDRLLVSYNRLTDILFDHLASRVDPAHCIEQILIELMRRGETENLHHLAVRAIGGETVISDLATVLLSRCANNYRDARRESDRIEAQCGF
jgi:hypothetical protein